MKRLIALFLCVFGFLTAPMRAEVELSFDFYYDELSRMGEWVEVDGYGYVWHPTGVDEDWAPYVDGYWTYTDAGWTWVSYEEWGAICYHYGRWVNLLDYGWCWVPGYDWGPAWVSWRRSEDYVGWAPLPPEVEWVPDQGVSVWVDTHYDIGPRYYNFCRWRDFGAPVIRHVIFPRVRNVEFCFSTFNITNITYNRGYGCVYNGGFDYDYVRARCDRTIPTLKLVQNTTNIFINDNRGKVFVNAPRGNTLVVAAPRVAANAKTFTRKPAIRHTFKRDAVTRGWAGLDKPETKDRLLGKMREETKGLSPTNAPARPVKQEALAIVPTKVDLDAKPAGLKRLPAERPVRGTVSQDQPATGREVNGRDIKPEKMRPNGRGETAEVPVVTDPPKAPGRGSVAEKDKNKDEVPGGLRKRPMREADAVTEVPQPAVTGRPLPENPGRDLEKPDRPNVAPVRPAERVPGRVVENPNDEKTNKAEKAAREAQETARRNAAAAENAAERGRLMRENAAQNNAAQAAAERAQRQREAAEVNRNAQEKAARDNAAQENAARANAAQENAMRERAAEAAAVRRAQAQSENAQKLDNQRRAAEQAESAQRRAAENAVNARREAEARQGENAKRQAMERQNDARQEAAQRQAEAQRERAVSQQNEIRQRQAEAMRERAAAQQNEARQRASEAARENQQRAAAAAQAQAQAQAQSQAQARAEAQQRGAAEAAARRQSEAKAQSQSEDPRKKKER